LEDAVKALQKATEADGYPCILIGTTCGADAVPGEVLGVFKQEIELGVSASTNI
jgi:peroxin-6